MRSPVVLTALGLGFAFASAAQAQVTLVNPGMAKDRIPQGVSLAASSPRSEAPVPAKPRAGQVLFSVEDADLKREVLPLIEEQAGVKIQWFGEPRSVTLRLVRPIDWEVALDLVAQFTNTHTTRRDGKIVLKDKWGGSEDESVAFDDLNGQLETPKRYTSKAASAPRRTMPVVRPRNIPHVNLGGGTIRWGARGRAAQVYRSRGARPPRPYVNPRGNRAGNWPSFF